MTIPTNSISRSPPSDTRLPIILGLLILMFGFGSFIFWAVTAPLDEGIPASGVLSVESKRKTISHLTGGLVKQILVREAQLVEPEQTLILLDTTATSANYESALQNYFALEAVVSRLKAEQSGASVIKFPNELTKFSQHPLALQHMKNQESLFIARRKALTGELAILAENSALNKEQAKGYQEQLSFLQSELDGVRALVGEGYAPRNQQFDLERQVSDLKLSLVKARQAAVDADLRAIQTKNTYHKEVETLLADSLRELASARDKVTIFREELDRSTIRSPVRGYVTGLSMHTVGGVVTPGMKLMDIVPDSEKLIFEVRVGSQFIDKVNIGLLADINLHNFPDSPSMVIEGKVISVSADLMTDPNPNIPPYFLVQVEVTKEGSLKLAGNQLHAGMQADVLIKTGERTLMTYILKPFLRRLHSSMTEI